MSNPIDPRASDEVIARFEELLEESARAATHVRRVPPRDHYLRLLKGEIEVADYARELERSCLAREFDATHHLEPRAADGRHAALDDALVISHAAAYLRWVAELEARRAEQQQQPPEDPNVALSALIGFARHTVVTTFVALTGLVLVIATVATHTISWSIDFTSVWLGILGVVIGAVTLRWAQQRAIHVAAPRLPLIEPPKRFQRLR